MYFNFRPLQACTNDAASRVLLGRRPKDKAAIWDEHEVDGDTVKSGLVAQPRAGRAFVYSSTGENVHTSLGSLRGTRSMLQFWFEARL